MPAAPKGMDTEETSGSGSSDVDDIETGRGGFKDKDLPGGTFDDGSKSDRHGSVPPLRCDLDMCS